MKISDIDFERKTIHIRQRKYKKDRIVPLADSMAVGLKKYLKAENPHMWLFNGKKGKTAVHKHRLARANDGKNTKTCNMSMTLGLFPAYSIC